MKLRIRYPEPDDCHAVFEGVRESIHEIHRWQAWCRLDYSLSDAAAWIAGQIEARSSGTAFEFVVLDARGLLLGCCGINQINPINRMANLGYWIRTSQTGRGYASEAARLTASWAFENTDVERLEILVATGNAGSLRVAQKLGAAREGVLRSRLLVHGVFHDAVMHSLLRSDMPRAIGPVLLT